MNYIPVQQDAFRGLDGLAGFRSTDKRCRKYRWG